MADTDDTMPTDEAIDTIWEFVKSIEFCMFVTWDGERQRARPLAARPRRDEHRIYFLSDVAGHKDEQVARFPKVTLAFADIGSHNYVSITGRAEVSDDRGKIADIWTAADKAWWNSAEDPSIRLIAFEPADAEVWRGPSKVFAAAKLLRAAVTGATADFGENRKVGQL